MGPAVNALLDRSVVGYPPPPLARARLRGWLALDSHVGLYRSASRTMDCGSRVDL